MIRTRYDLPLPMLHDQVNMRAAAEAMRQHVGRDDGPRRLVITSTHGELVPVYDVEHGVLSLVCAGCGHTEARFAIAPIVPDRDTHAEDHVARGAEGRVAGEA